MIRKCSGACQPRASSARMCIFYKTLNAVKSSEYSEMEENCKLTDRINNLISLTDPTKEHSKELTKLLYTKCLILVVGQCYRCQSFRHSAQGCYADPRCVKCAKAHFTYTCKKPRTEPATCANCGNDHPANYKGCPSFPKPGQQATDTITRGSRPQANQQQASRPRPNPVVPGKCYAACAASTQSAETTTRSQQPQKETSISQPQPAELINKVIGSFTNLSEDLKKQGSVFDKLSLILDAVNKLTQNA